MEVFIGIIAVIVMLVLLCLVILGCYIAQTLNEISAILEKIRWEIE